MKVKVTEIRVKGPIGKCTSIDVNKLRKVMLEVAIIKEIRKERR